MNSTNSKRFVTLGMYAFTPRLRQAWQAIFTAFRKRWPQSSSLAPDCRWVFAPEDLDQPELLFGQSCGYPLTHQLSGRVTPFCVPSFDVPGWDSSLYSSQFIVRTDSDINELADARGKVVAINNQDSNSGMNVLRYAIAPMAGKQHFFKSIRLTGGHLASMQSIADGETDIAAIDAASYHLALEAYPQLSTKLRSLGFSKQTTGLPLVYLANDREFDAETCTRLLNEALRDCEPWVTEILHLRGFLPVKLDDYDSILEIEKAAIDLGYHSLV